MTLALEILAAIALAVFIVDKLDQVLGAWFPPKKERP